MFLLLYTFRNTNTVRRLCVYVIQQNAEKMNEKILPEATEKFITKVYYFRQKPCNVSKFSHRTPDLPNVYNVYNVYLYVYVGVYIVYYYDNILSL